MLAVLGLCSSSSLGGNTLSLAIAANDQPAKLEALDHVPTARACSRCPDALQEHLGVAAQQSSRIDGTVRREGFANDQWLMEGMNLLDLKYRAAGDFAADPSELVRPNNCRDGLHRTLNTSLALLPRGDFDYVWLIDPPPYDPSAVAGMQPVWRGGGSILYRLHP